VDLQRKNLAGAPSAHLADEKRRAVEGVAGVAADELAVERAFGRQHGELGAWLEVLSEERRVLTGKLQRRFQRAACKSYIA